MTDSIMWRLGVLTVRWGVDLHVLLAELQGSDIYTEGSGSSECH